MGVLVVTVLSLPATQAAKLVSWDDLAKDIGYPKNGRYRVITKAGMIYVGHSLVFSPTGVRVIDKIESIPRRVIDKNESIPREQVTEIRIHHHRRVSLACGLILTCKDEEPNLPYGGIVYVPVALILGALPAISIALLFSPSRASSGCYWTKCLKLHLSPLAGTMPARQCTGF
jgi:hypothetical protein